MSKPRYMALLKGKEAEFKALGDIGDDVKERLSPLVEVPPIPWDYEKGCEKSVTKHVANVAPSLAGGWGTELPILVDLPYIAARKTVANGKVAAAHVFDEARGAGIQLVPVTGVRREALYQETVRDAVVADSRGVCIRLEPTDFSDPRHLADLVDGLRSYFRVRPTEVDLVLDLRGVDAKHVTSMALAASAMIRWLPTPTAWRSLTLASCAFPVNLSSMRAQRIRRLPRADADVWKELGSATLPRTPDFGDYVVTHPEPFAMDPRKMHMSANIRYTADESFVVLKGSAVKTAGWEQTARMCKVLVAQPEFKGAGYSWGDDYIDRRARGRATCGNATTWRRVATAHHLTLVAERVATTGAP